MDDSRYKEVGVAMEKVTWELSNGQPDKAEKMRHIAEIQITDDMSQGTRDFAVNYNEMRDMLLKNNLMKKK